MRRGRSGSRQPGGGEKAASRGRGHGRDRDERHKERSKAHFAQRQSDMRAKHAPKRSSPSLRVAEEVRSAPPVEAKPTFSSAGVQTVTVTPDESNMRIDRFF